MHILVDGDLYVAKSNGTYIPSKNKCDAVQFKTTDAANNVRKSGLPKILRQKYNWKIQEVIEECPSVAETTKNSNPQYAYVDTDALINSIKELSGKFSMLQGNKEWLLEQESNLDKQISDVLHWIEFNTFSACEGYKLCKALKNLRLQRRKIKNELELINIINMHTCNHIAKGNTSRAIDGLNSKQYEPRVLSDLFANRSLDAIYKN